MIENPKIELMDCFELLESDCQDEIIWSDLSKKIFEGCFKSFQKFHFTEGFLNIIKDREVIDSFKYNYDSDCFLNASIFFRKQQDLDSDIRE